MLDVAAGDPPANAAAADVANCAPDSPFIDNLHSENGSPSGTDDPTGRSNRIERVDATAGATTVAVDEYEGGDPPDWAEDVVVEGRYSCTLDGEEVAGGDWSAAFGESAGPFDVPAGSACTITQDELPPVPDGSWQWEAPVVDPDGPVTIPEGGTGVITVTNRLTRLSGGFTVTKAIAGEGTPDPSLTFAGQWRCVYPGPDDETATGAWGPVPAGQAWTSAGDAGIPRTSSCVVLGEDEPGPSGPGLEWDGEPDLGAPVTASEQPGEAATTVTDTVAPAPGPTPTPTPTLPPAPSPSSSTSGPAGGGGLSDTGNGAGAPPHPGLGLAVLGRRRKNEAASALRPSVPAASEGPWPTPFRGSCSYVSTTPGARRWPPPCSTASPTAGST
jgi:hypothetical protein